MHQRGRPVRGARTLPWASAEAMAAGARADRGACAAVSLRHTAATRRRHRRALRAAGRAILAAVRAPPGLEVDVGGAMAWPLSLRPPPAGELSGVRLPRPPEPVHDAHVPRRHWCKETLSVGPFPPTPPTLPLPPGLGGADQLAGAAAGSEVALATKAVPIAADVVVYQVSMAPSTSSAMRAPARSSSPRWRPSRGRVALDDLALSLVRVLEEIGDASEEELSVSFLERVEHHIQSEAQLIDMVGQVEGAIDYLIAARAVAARTPLDGDAGRDRRILSLLDEAGVG